MLASTAARESEAEKRSGIHVLVLIHENKKPPPAKKIPMTK